MEPESLSSSTTCQIACLASWSGFFSMCLKCRVSQIKFSIFSPGRLPDFLHDSLVYPRFLCHCARAHHYTSIPLTTSVLSLPTILGQALVSLSGSQSGCQRLAYFPDPQLSPTAQPLYFKKCIWEMLKSPPTPPE